MPVTDNFQDVEQAAYYQRCRPCYPASLYTHIISLLDDPPAGQNRHGLVVDVGCGSGQTTLPLAQYFTQVIGVDPSQAQIDEAVKQASAMDVTNITYRVGLAERLDFLSEDSVDLVTVGTALHWFDVPRFCAECRRVLRPGGVVVAYSYGRGEFLLQGSEQENGRECREFYSRLLTQYADVNVSDVFDRYVKFVPTFEQHFSETIRDDESNRIDWSFSLEGLKGFFKSMSMYQRYKRTLEQDQPNPLDACFDRLAASYPGGPPEDAVRYQSEIAVLSGRK